jgi:hypothetical protein
MRAIAALRTPFNSTSDASRLRRIQQRQHPFLHLLGRKRLADVSLRPGLNGLLDECSSLDSVVIITTGTPGARFCARIWRRNSSPSIEGILMSERIRSTLLGFQQLQSLRLPLPASKTTSGSRPAWRSERSTILRITEESSTIRVRTSLMPSSSAPHLYRLFPSIHERHFFPRSGFRFNAPPSSRSDPESSRAPASVRFASRRHILSHRQS